MKGSVRILAGLASATALLMTGCAATPVPELAADDVPAGWEQATPGSDVIWPDLDWWQAFESSELNELVTRLETSNLDLEINRVNLSQAQLTLQDAGFNLWPVPVLSVGANENYSGNRPDGGDYTDGTSSSANASLSVSYTDILSKPANYKSAKLNYESSLASAVDLRLNTLSTAASTYFQILLTRDRILAAEQNLANAEAVARITETRAEVGMITPLDALQQRIAVDQQKASLSSLRQSEYSARAALALMMASSVTDFDVSATTLEDVVVPEVKPGLPSELLVRRPDLVQAKANLARSANSVDLARLAYLPNISLTGSANLQSDSLSALLSSSDLFVNAAASVAQTLLTNGSRRRNVKRAQLSLESSIASYRKAVIGAFNNIEVSLSNVELLDELARVAASNLDLAEESFRLAEVRYREGEVDYQTVLVAQVTLFNSRNSLLDNKLARLNAVIGLYTALGGGWQQGEESVAYVEGTAM